MASQTEKTPALAGYCIIRSWDTNNHPDSVGRSDTEEDAQAKVSKLVGRGYTGAFYLNDVDSPDGSECWRNPIHWIVDPDAKTAVIDMDSVANSWRDRRKQDSRRHAKGLLEEAFEAVDIVLMGSIRDARNTLAGQIDAMTLAKLKALDVRSWSGWS